MKNFDPVTLAALDDRAASMRLMLRFDLPEGSFGFWTGIGPLVYEGLTYVGSARLISIDELSGTDDFAVVPIIARLSSIPDTALTPDVLGTIFSYQWHQAPAVLFHAYLHPDTNALIKVERIARRRIDTIDMDEKVGGEATLIASLQPVTLDNPGRGFMMYGDADQRLIDPDDGFFSFAATAGEQTIEWGRAPQAVGVPGAGSGFAGVG